MQEKIKEIFKEQCQRCCSKSLCGFCHYTIELSQYKLDIAYIKDICHITWYWSTPSSLSATYVTSTTLADALSWILNQSTLTLEDTLKILKFKNTYTL